MPIAAAVLLTVEGKGVSVEIELYSAGNVNALTELDIREELNSLVGGADTCKGGAESIGIALVNVGVGIALVVGLYLLTLGKDGSVPASYNVIYIGTDLALKRIDGNHVVGIALTHRGSEGNVLGYHEDSLAYVTVNGNLVPRLEHILKLSDGLDGYSLLTALYGECVIGNGICNGLVLKAVAQLANTVEMIGVGAELGCKLTLVAVGIGTDGEVVDGDGLLLVGKVGF